MSMPGEETIAEVGDSGIVVAPGAVVIDDVVVITVNVVVVVVVDVQARACFFKKTCMSPKTSSAVRCGLYPFWNSKMAISSSGTMKTEPCNPNK